MIKTNEFIEYAEVYGNYYGTHKRWLQEELDNNLSHILLELDVQGAMSIKKIFPESVRIFINPPNLDVLKKDLRKEEKIQLNKLKLDFQKLIKKFQLDQVLSML